MKSKNSLVIGRGIFTIFIIVSFGLIIVNEKEEELFKTKATKKIDTYLETNFSELKDSILKEDITYKNSNFKRKITSKKNKNLFFYIQYNNKKITDTYQKDYIEGCSLLTYLDQKLEKDIQKKTKEKCSVKAIAKLNEYSEKVQEKIIQEDNLLQLKFYSIEKEITIDNWNQETITEEITNFIKEMKENDITPKYYEITITNSQDITTSVEISNLTESILEMTNTTEIIKDILEDNNSEQVKNAKISYQYQN